MTNAQIVGGIVLGVPLVALYVVAAIGERRSKRSKRLKALAEPYDLHPIHPNCLCPIEPAK